MIVLMELMLHLLTKQRHLDVCHADKVAEIVLLP
jgi:hypothetical protein